MRRLAATLLAVLLLIACADGCARRDQPVVAFLGDSLTAGWGLDPESAYPAQVGRVLAGRGHPIRVLNFGRGGDTVAQGRARLPQVLDQRPDVVVVALGLNDAIRGMSVEVAERDLRSIVADIHARGSVAILVGVPAPPAWANAHTHKFTRMYETLAADLQVPFVADLLAETASVADRMFPDQLHPSALGHRQLAENVRPVLERVLDAHAPAGKR